MNNASRLGSRRVRTFPKKEREKSAQNAKWALVPTTTGL